MCTWSAWNLKAESEALAVAWGEDGEAGVREGLGKVIRLMVMFFYF